MFTAILSVVAVVLSAASLVLHKVAPMTKTKADDKARDVVDFAKDKVLPVAGTIAGAADAAKGAEPVKLTTLPSGAVARDHRK